MVYIYAFVGRLFFYPYLTYKTSRLLPEAYCRPLRWLFGVELALSTLSLLVHRFVMHEVMSSIMSINIYIFFALGYSVAFLMLLGLGQSLLQRLSGRSLRSLLSVLARHRLDWAVAISTLTIFVAVLYGGYRGGHDIRVVHHSLGDTTQAPLARLALVTDLHIGEGVGLSHVRQVVERIMALQPDAILFGGDYIDHDVKYARQPEIMAEMRKLSAPDGVYFVLGNHEYRADTLDNQRWVKDLGFTLLIDSIAYPRGGAYSIIGRDDYVQRGRKSLDSLLSQLEPKPYNILLEHTPEDLDSLRQSPLDLALYGHTHAGQVFPYKYLLYLKYSVPYGTAEYDRTKVIVSSGVGAAGTLFRLGTQSEIVCITLYPKKSYGK